MGKIGCVGYYKLGWVVLDLYEGGWDVVFGLILICGMVFVEVV